MYTYSDTQTYKKTLLIIVVGSASFTAGEKALLAVKITRMQTLLNDCCTVFWLSWRNLELTLSFHGSVRTTRWGMASLPAVVVGCSFAFAAGVEITFFIVLLMMSKGYPFAAKMFLRLDNSP